jgi:hypothetical protein
VTLGDEVESLLCVYRSRIPRHRQHAHSPLRGGVYLFIYISAVACCCWTQNNLLVSDCAAAAAPFARVSSRPSHRDSAIWFRNKMQASSLCFCPSECGGQGIASSSWHVTSHVRTRRGCNIFNSSPQRVARAHYLRL